MLTSYIDKKKLGQKNVIVLSSVHDSVKVTKSQRKKPSVHAMYDHSKGGIIFLVYCWDLIPLASNANDSLWMVLRLFATPVDQMPRRYCKITE